MTRRDLSRGRYGLLLLSSLCSSVLANAALAAERDQASAAGAASDSQNVIEEIVVTAQKREERLSAVPMTIAAATSQQLEEAGIEQVRDLAKLTPGFKYTDSLAGTPVYSLRGVGYDDIALAARPTVTVYVDQAPIAFSIETRGAAMDLERVEVLKGPQGTLFGNNATGGAINYIAAKPTQEFKAGVGLTYGNFDQTQVSGFLSGPITDTLRGRVAIEKDGMADWQRGFTIPDRNGRVDFTNMRGTLEFEPTSRFKDTLTVSRWVDQSDTQAPYLIGTPGTTGNWNNPAAAANFPEILNYPLPPRDPRAADFTPRQNYSKSNTFVSVVNRIDFALTDTLDIVSLTTYNRYKGQMLQDTDGLRFVNNELTQTGKLTTKYQELRLAGRTDRSHYTVGLTYQDDVARESNIDREYEGTLSQLFAGFGAPTMQGFGYDNNQDATTKAAFVSGDFDVTPAINVYGGARYTKFKDDFFACSSDLGDGSAVAGFGALLNLFRSLNDPPLPPLAPGVLVPGGCFSYDEQFNPGIARLSLDESNVSWRAGVKYTLSDDSQVYLNVSKGYKAGGFSTILALPQSEYTPAKQESVLAYEVGFKSTLFDRRLQLNGAAFYYDYQDKQILGRIADPFAGPITTLINIPESRIAGAELQATAIPVEGLTITVAGSYISSKVLGDFSNYDPNGVFKKFSGESFAGTPKVTVVTDVKYQRPLNANLDWFVGGNSSTQSSTYSQFGSVPELKLPSYTLVDLRAGVSSQNDVWRAWAWVRNAGDKFYLTSANRLVDTTTGYTGMPRTYGASISWSF
jgi:outer membrane receptor protein involved in Fe transport